MRTNFYTVDRLPPYVFAEVNEAKMKARRAGEDIIDLGMGNPDVPPPEPVVEKLCEAARNPRNHRYSTSRGIPNLRRAITEYYADRYDVELDPDTEAIVTLGAKEGLAHLALAAIAPGDKVLVPTPTYPIHAYGVILARGDLRSVPLSSPEGFLVELEKACVELWPKPTVLVASFPHNPTTVDVDPGFFEALTDFAGKNHLMVIHDLAYAEIAFDGYSPPSFLQAKGARDVGVEFYSMSKGFSMPGWRVGFCVGNAAMVQALGRVKSYLDYGAFQPVQIAAITALRECRDEIPRIVDIYKVRRDCLVRGLDKAGWHVDPPRSTMFVWSRVPEQFAHMGSMAFAKLLIAKAKVAVAPGIGFGAHGEGYVRFALVENEHRIRQAVRGIREVLQGGVSPAALRS